MKIRETNIIGVEHIVAVKEFSIKLAPVGWIDTPRYMDNYSGNFYVSEWALDESQIEKIEVFIDGVLTGEATYGDYRPDVQKVYPDYNNNNSGYHYRLDTYALQEGKHVLEIRATSKNGEFALPPKEFSVSKLP